MNQIVSARLMQLVKLVQAGHESGKGGHRASVDSVRLITGTKNAILGRDKELSS
ncbi:hypothetical protein [Paenacidovorax monticola]|uniref:Uncharacterized protein n=1 Tax=Paenacidovorax monticola TaxID=1926868 RepID=A0A7H0HHP6_9BURK|nr:hypothetical protein [Paenacidovorax monticola]QNP60062.1 hypothetical protein H9L24_03835 [Paenacidovorax monticola]